MPDGNERRRDGSPVSYAELRAALQPLFDQKARIEPTLRFFEAMRLIGIEELLPMMLKDERVRLTILELSGLRLARWRRLAIILGVLGGFALIGSFLLNIWQVVNK